MCSSAEAPAPGGWVAWLGWASCCGSPSRTRLRPPRPPPARWPATTGQPHRRTGCPRCPRTAPAPTARPCPRPRPVPRRAGPSPAGHCSSSWRRVQVRVVVVRPLADPWCPARGATCVLVHLVDEVADDRVRGTGDADRAAVRDELEDLFGRGVRLAGSRRSLDRQVGAAERGREPDRGGAAVSPSARSGPAAALPSSGGRRSSSAVAASPPLRPSRATRSPRSRSRSRCSRSGRPGLDQRRGQRPGVVPAHLQVDRPARVVHAQIDQSLSVPGSWAVPPAENRCSCGGKRNRRTTDLLTWPTTSPPARPPSASGSPVSSSGLSVRR